MKHIFIVVLLLTAYTSSFANTISYKVSQNSWRWRNNDGSETTASWKAGQSTVINYNSINEVVRLRIEIVNASTSYNCQYGICRTVSYTINMDDSLQYSTTPTDLSSWKNIGLNSNLPFVMANGGNYVVQNDTTSSQITGNSYAFSPGKIMVSDSVLKNVSIPSPNRSEFEWAIRGTSNTAPNTTYYFRQKRIYIRSNPLGSEVATQYPIGYPSLTTGTTLPIKLSSFTANNEGKKVKLEWSTASEANNDYFNIQRSTDGLMWETINKVNSKGNSSVTTNYYLYDYGPPLTGTVYYRLQQYDKDGQFSFSDVQSVKMFSTNNAVVSVIPNPARSDIHFKLENTAVKNVQATLTDVNGRVLHEQTFINVQPGNLNRLSLKQQPAPGIYILKLKGDGLSESIKVIVQ